MAPGCCEDASAAGPTSLTCEKWSSLLLEHHDRASPSGERGRRPVPQKPCSLECTSECLADVCDGLIDTLLTVEELDRLVARRIPGDALSAEHVLEIVLLDLAHDCGGRGDLLVVEAQRVLVGAVVRGHPVDSRQHHRVLAQLLIVRRGV